MPKSSKPEKKSIEQYDPTGKERMNNPPVGHVTPEKKITAILQEVAG